MGRLLSYYMKTRQYNHLENFLEDCRYNHTDWMGGQGEPYGWEGRFSIARDQWSENWLLHERDLLIQEDLECFAEAVYQFYQVHLDKLIRENDKLRGDFCKKKYDDAGNEIGLEVNTWGYDMTIPGIEIPMTKKTIIPDPETHFSFSTKLMVLAIDLYQSKKLTQFVDSRKDMTAQSYRFFVEHAYNQFFQHEAFHQPARARTKAKDLGAGGFHTSTKLDGYVWLATTDKMAHVPKDQADVNMEDDEDADEEVELLPALEVVLRPQAEEKEEEHVSSQQREETSQQAGRSDQTEIPELEVPRGNSPEERYGIYFIRQLKPEYQELLRDMAFNSQNVLNRDDREGREPLRREEIGYFSMVFMMEYLVHESHKSFMEFFAPSTRTDITDEQYHEFRLELKRVKEANRHINQDNFEDVDEPDLMDDDPNIPLQRHEDQGPADPELKGTVES